MTCLRVLALRERPVCPLAHSICRKAETNTMLTLPRSYKHLFNRSFVVLLRTAVMVPLLGSYTIDRPLSAWEIDC